MLKGILGIMIISLLDKIWRVENSTLDFKIKPNCVYFTGSVTSLAAGLLFGLLAAVGAYLASQNPKNVWLSLGEQVLFVKL